jgi:hypothetical protein
MALFGRTSGGAANLSEARDRSLSMRPLRNPLVRSEVVEREGEGRGGATFLLVPVERTKRGRLVAWLLRRLSRRPVPEAKRIELDEIGAFVWGLCDGTRTTRQIIRGLAREYHLNRRDAEASLVEFLRMLGRRNLVGFQAAPPGEAGPEPPGSPGGP